MPCLTCVFCGCMATVGAKMSTFPCLEKRFCGSIVETLHNALKQTLFLFYLKENVAKVSSHRTTYEKTKSFVKDGVRITTFWSQSHITMNLLQQAFMFLLFTVNVESTGNKTHIVRFSVTLCAVFVPRIMHLCVDNEQFPAEDHKFS